MNILLRHGWHLNDQNRSCQTHFRIPRFFCVPENPNHIAKVKNIYRYTPHTRYSSKYLLPQILLYNTLICLNLIIFRLQNFAGFIKI